MAEADEADRVRLGVALKAIVFLDAQSPLGELALGLARHRRA
jgi:hypothetical protein